MTINSNVVKAVAGGITLFGAGVASTKLGELAIGKIKEIRAAKAEPEVEEKPKKK
jgi:hypothetical protein